MKKALLGTGLSGLVGSRLVQLFQNEYEIQTMDTSATSLGVDITDRNQVFEAVKSSASEWIIHLAALTNVDECEKDRIHGTEGVVWKVNVEGTRNIVEAAKKYTKRVIFISTDFVFDGSQAEYTEMDTPHPINWYGVTKAEGEKIVMTDPNNIIVRITYPYRAHCPKKQDFVHTIVNTFKKNIPVLAVTDHWFAPTFIDDIAAALEVLMKQNTSGVYHVVGSQVLTPFEAVQLIAREFGFNENLITETTLKEFYKDRAPRPFKLATKNDKITTLGVRMSTFVEGLVKVKREGIDL